MEIKDRQGNIILSDKGQDNMLERLYRTVDVYKRQRQYYG